MWVRWLRRGWRWPKASGCTRNSARCIRWRRGVERSSQILTELTRNVGIVAALPALAQELDQIELLPLADRRVLMILVTRDQMVRNRVVTLEEPIPPDELLSIRNYVNRNFSGWRLGDARRELLRRMLEERALYSAVMGKLQVLCSKGLLDVDTSPEVHMEGASNLLGLDLHLTREKLRELLRALEEKQRLIDLLDRFLELPPGELEVRVGLEEAHPAMKDLALIGMTRAAGQRFAGQSRRAGSHADAVRAGDGSRHPDQPGARERAVLNTPTAGAGMALVS